MRRMRVDMGRARQALTVGGFGCALIFGTLGCTSRGQGDCYPPGTYVDLDQTIGTSTARICFGDDCQTLAAGTGDGNVTTGFYRSNEFDGNSTVVDILVFNETGEVVGQISEKRSLNSAQCQVFGYWWQDGSLRRQT